MYASLNLSPTGLGRENKAEIRLAQGSYERQVGMDRHQLVFQIDHGDYTVDHLVADLSAAQLAKLRDTIGGYLDNLSVATSTVSYPQEVQS